MAALTISSASVGYAQENTEQSYEGVTLQIAHSVTDSNADSFQAEFDAFEEKYGCTIEVERLSSDADEMESVMQVRAATGNLPDIWLNSVGAKLEAMSPDENCYDLSGEAWIKERVNEAYLDIVTDSDSGAVYGIPSRPSNVAGVFHTANLGRIPCKLCSDPGKDRQRSGNVSVQQRFRCSDFIPFSVLLRAGRGSGFCRKIYQERN